MESAFILWHFWFIFHHRWHSTAFFSLFSLSLPPLFLHLWNKFTDRAVFPFGFCREGFCHQLSIINYNIKKHVLVETCVTSQVFLFLTKTVSFVEFFYVYIRKRLLTLYRLSSSASLCWKERVFTWHSYLTFWILIQLLDDRKYFNKRYTVSPTL